jgi:transcriptional regulator GlxA family with amidase domain
MKTKLNYIQNWSELAREAEWSASALAEKCSVAVRTLERHFHNQMGQSPKFWLVRQRQRKAIDFLAHGLSVKETARELGYKHAAHFSRDFKKAFGYNPHQARLAPEHKENP